MEQLKFCKDCEHYAPPTETRGDQCRNETNTTVDLVSGGNLYVRSPKELRADGARCGGHAVWFAQGVDQLRHSGGK